MLLVLELSEFLRALGFPGSDVFVLITGMAALLLAFSLRAGICFWIAAIYLAGTPLLYSLTSSRIELASIAMSVLIFMLALAMHEFRWQIPVRVRVVLFFSLVVLSYVLPVGDPIYHGSSFSSLFFSGNAFINYLLITACYIAFVSRSVIVSVVAALPLVLIQTKSVVALVFSNKRMVLLALAATYPLMLFVSSFDRLYWMMTNHGLVYALGAGRIERFLGKAGSEISISKIIIGSPFPGVYENFEIEFIDLVHDFGLFYSAVLYCTVFVLLRKRARFDFWKLLVLFVILNLSGHFWNNPILIIAFAGLVHYVNRHNHEYVSR